MGFRLQGNPTLNSKGRCIQAADLFICSVHNPKINAIWSLGLIPKKRPSSEFFYTCHGAKFEVKAGFKVLQKQRKRARVGLTLDLPQINMNFAFVLIIRRKKEPSWAFPRLRT